MIGGTEVERTEFSLVDLDTDDFYDNAEAKEMLIIA